MKEIRSWWKKLTEIGPKYGYHPKPSKSVLIIKDPSLLQEATRLFAGSGITISYQGERHLGAAIGNETARGRFVSSKVNKWIEDLKILSEIAVEEPQAALSAYSKCICHRWTYIQRTMSNISHLFAPLEECIRSTFIPALVGRQISDTERKMLSLPVRFGGLGIANPSETADREYNASRKVTADLKNLIIAQQQDMALYNSERIITAVKEVKAKKRFF